MESGSTYSLNSLSNELLCHIFQYLPVKQVLRVGTLNRNLNYAVELHLSHVKQLNFCEGEIIGYMSKRMTDRHLLTLLKKCPRVEVILGFHPVRVTRSRSRKGNGLSIPGIIDALLQCSNLKKIEISSIGLLEAFSLQLPNVHIEGYFRNRDNAFPWENNQVKLFPLMKLTSLHLIGVQVPELVGMQDLQHIYLQWVSFTRLYPFRSFAAKKLKSFVMKQCVGPAFPLRYYPLFIALGAAQELTRLEIASVPILGGMIARSVEEASRHNGFRNISKLLVADCKGIMESDLGQLMIACSQNLETLAVQASLTKDSLFASLHFVGCDFSHLKTLHLGYNERRPARGEWPDQVHAAFSMAEALSVPSSLSDRGIDTVAQLFPNVQTLTISNCHHIIDPRSWCREHSLWNSVTSLIMERCNCLLVSSFAQFASSLDNLEVLVMKNLCRPPPKGCSYVGLSAGTGLGLSSAIVSTRYEHIAVVVRDSGDDDEGENVAQNQPEVRPQRRRLRNLAVPGQQRHLEPPLEQNQCDPAVPGTSGTNPSHRRRSSRNRTPASVPKKKRVTRQSRNTEPKLKARAPVRRTRKTLPHNKAKPSNSDNPSPSCSFPRRTFTKHSEMMSDSEKSVSEQDSDANSEKRYGQKRLSSVTKKDSGCIKQGEPEISNNEPSWSEDRYSSDDDEEPDPVVTFHITSKSLISITIMVCGITNLEFEQCSALVHIEVQSCCIMKKFEFQECEALMKINVAHCPKLTVSDFVSDVLKINSKSPLMVYLRPVSSRYSPRSLVNAVMYHAANVYRSLYVMHHYHKSDTDSAQFRENFFSWMQNVQLYMQTKPLDVSRSRFAPLCWGYQLHKLNGLSGWGNYELLTNNGDFIAYWQSNDLEKSEFLQGPASHDIVLPESLKLSGPDPSGDGFFIGKHQIGFFIDLKT